MKTIIDSDEIYTIDHNIAQKLKNNYPHMTTKTNVGFGNYVRSEALPGALPKGQNNPQKCPYGLFAEQLSGTAFTKTPRHANLRAWLYRIRPSVQHSPFKSPDRKTFMPHFVGDVGTKGKFHPDQMRWMPLNPNPDEPTTFVQGLRTVGGNGEPGSTAPGFAIHLYACNKSMGDVSFTNADGDFLIVPQLGTLKVTTEFGAFSVKPTEICVVMRGMRFSVDVEGPSRGYVCELFQRHFTLPELGPIGSNGLANPQDFEMPSARYEDREDIDYEVVHKLGGEIFVAKQNFSPFNVVAWQGNYVPYKYDLKKFCCMNSVTYDHPDPSIYTVLTCQGDEPGVAIVDFVIFPPRWMVMEHSFRPPWFHRNCMSEYMGMIWGEYDAKGGDKKGSGFVRLSLCREKKKKRRIIRILSSSYIIITRKGGNKKSRTHT